MKYKLKIHGTLTIEIVDLLPIIRLNCNGDFIFGRKEKEYKSNIQPININITFTGDEKSNEINANRLEEMINRVIKQQVTKYNNK